MNQFEQQRADAQELIGEPARPPQQGSIEDLRNRFGYHRATEETAELHRQVRSVFQQTVAQLHTIVPEGRAKAMMWSELEAAQMRANQAIATQLAPLTEGE